MALTYPLPQIMKNVREMMLNVQNPKLQLNQKSIVFSVVVASQYTIYRLLIRAHQFFEAENHGRYHALNAHLWVIIRCEYTYICRRKRDLYTK